MPISMPECGTLRSQSRLLLSMPWEDGRLVVEKEWKQLLPDGGSMMASPGRTARFVLSTNGSQSRVHLFQLLRMQSMPFLLRKSSRQD